MDELLIKEATISQPLPHSVEAEQAVLGGLMLKNEAFESISDVLVEKDFYNKDHQLIFSAMVTLADNGQPFDPITLSENLQSKNHLATIGGAEYLVELTERTRLVPQISKHIHRLSSKGLLSDNLYWLLVKQFKKDSTL